MKNVLIANRNAEGEFRLKGLESPRVIWRETLDFLFCQRAPFARAVRVDRFFGRGRLKTVSIVD
jgi:hypothetical protein